MQNTLSNVVLIEHKMTDNKITRKTSSLSMHRSVNASRHIRVKALHTVNLDTRWTSAVSFLLLRNLRQTSTSIEYESL
jgi:hypothetical protein